MSPSPSDDCLPAVFPILDVYDGVIEFRVDGQWERRWVADIHSLDAVLRRSVCRPEWDSFAETLVVRIASLGRRSGLRVEVPLLAACPVMAVEAVREVRDLEPA
ncbi:hypothetical protein BJ994_000134 [Arthrobacter pigmenti]|uniref:Uncharacterized protein n=1 Tax=Arthrobacter pigmenti TaxID=271432 RepID=A0A846RD73_9MICC|nr:hypothetical protein [Arthrobacter pigmenti]NJC21058.1 hypothetical protein [Arthrobacter pigmenti]